MGGEGGASGSPSDAGSAGDDQGGEGGAGGSNEPVDPCVGVTCDSPPANTCESATKFLAYDPIGTCVEGECDYTSKQIACSCSGDACTTDPCAAVTCNTPPSPACPNTTTRRTFSATGTCAAGSCSYTPTDAACPFVCAGGACTGECVPGTARCDTATGVPQVCGSNGFLQNKPACGANSACAGGACLCTTGYTDCSGSCAQLSTSAAHCGACGHSCLGGECVAGKCKPVELAAGQVQAQSLAVSSTHVYWMDETGAVGNVKRVSKSGGAVETLATTQGYPGGLALTSNAVYWGTLGSNGKGGVPRFVYRANLDGSSRTEFEPYAKTIDNLVIADGIVCWNDRDLGVATKYYSKPVGGSGSATLLGSTTSPGTNITAAGGCLYYSPDGKSITRLCPGTTGIGVFSTTSSVGFSPQQSSDATMLYFGVTQRGVVRLPLTGTTAATDVIAGTDVRSLIVDGSVLYYIDGSTGGAPACTTNWGLYRTTKTPGGARVELIPPPMECPYSLVTDSEALYWMNGNTGTIVKMAK